MTVKKRVSCPKVRGLKSFRRLYVRGNSWKTMIPIILEKKIFLSKGEKPGLYFVKVSRPRAIIRKNTYFITSSEIRELRIARATRKPLEKQIPTGISLFKE